MQTTAAKFWAALLIVTANTLRNRYGIDLGIDEQLANDIVGYLLACAVWAVPNKPKVKVQDFKGENV